MNDLPSFGPQQCVSVYRDQNTGTCNLETKCEGKDLSNVEFAFTCHLDNVIQKHSFGKGGERDYLLGFEAQGGG